MKDDLNAARGILVGVVLGLIFWTVIIGIAIAGQEPEPIHVMRDQFGYRLGE
jgi:hypothetical protein